MHRAAADRFFLFAVVVATLAGCSGRPTTMGDLYLESRTALEAYRRGNYRYVPANGKITVTTAKEAAQFRIVAVGSVNDRKMALHLAFPSECLLKHAACLHDANKEFEALKKCADKVVSRTPVPPSCSAAPQIMDGVGGLTVRNRQYAPHMDMWVSDLN